MSIMRCLFFDKQKMDRADKFYTNSNFMRMNHFLQKSVKHTHTRQIIVASTTPF